MNRLILIASFLVVATALGQEGTNTPAPNYAVQYYGPGNSYNYPQYWPKTQTTIGTNTVAPNGWFFFTPEQYGVLLATNQIEFNVAKSNRLYALNTKSSANLARITQLFNQIPTARGQMTNIQDSTIANVGAASTAIKAEANVIDSILEELQRLGPVLKSIYRSELDSTP